MKKRVKLTILLLCTIISFQTQGMTTTHGTDSSSNKPTSTKTKNSFEFTASSEIESTKNISDDEAGSHFLGDEIAKKMYLYNEQYSYKEPVAPGNSATKTILRKPEIYSSVRKIEKYLKKQVKEGDMTTEIARSQYDKVLDVALNILDANTESFEKRLKAAGGDRAELLDIYLHEVKLEYLN